MIRFPLKERITWTEARVNCINVKTQIDWALGNMCSGCSASSPLPSDSGFLPSAGRPTCASTLPPGQPSNPEKFKYFPMFGLSDLLPSPAQVTVSPASASKANLLHIILFFLFYAEAQTIVCLKHNGGGDQPEQPLSCQVVRLPRRIGMGSRGQASRPSSRPGFRFKGWWQ